MVSVMNKTSWYGWPRFYGGSHPKAAMQQCASNLPGPVLQLQVTQGYGEKLGANGYKKYGRSFVAVPEINKNIGKLSNLLVTQLHPANNHVNEIIVKGAPCKIVMDFDRDEGFPLDHFADRLEFCKKVERALTRILAKDFGVKLVPQSFVWMFTEYTYKQKFSAHLVIHHVMPDGSLVVVPCHKHTLQHGGSRHFLQRLAQELPSIESVRDDSIYSDDREMRLPYACKPNEDNLSNWKPGTLRLADQYRPFSDALVTYFEGRPLHVLQMPTVEPSRPIRAAKQPNAPDGTEHTTQRSRPPAHLTCSDVEQLVLDCLRAKVHPTAYLCVKGDVFDRWNSPRFSYRDRTEVCWCGHKHDNLHFSAWAAGNEVYAHCFSAKAPAGRKTIRIGCLEDDFSHPTDTEVNMRFLDRKPCPQVSGRDTQVFGQEVANLLNQRQPVMCIQSPMGTGKTHMLKNLIYELDLLLGRPSRVCIITYRTTLALSMMADLEELGFINYLDAKSTDTMETADKVIVQLDSIGMVMRRCRIIPRYDLVVLDESESTLHHTTAKTHGTRQRLTFEMFCSIVRAAERVLVMDALLGRETRMFLKAVGRKPRVVRNVWRSDKPRTFEFTNDQDSWLRTLVQQLQAGRNCAIASMSATKLHQIKDYLVSNGILDEADILLYDSFTDDCLKRQVRDVNKFWARFRLVMWSPAVEAGVNFDVPHFHSLFVIISNMSTVAMGEVQSQGRIRILENLRVMCWCQHGVAWDPKGQEMRPEDAVQHLRWHQDLVLRNCQGTGVGNFGTENFAPNIIKTEEEVLQGGEIALLPAPDTAGMVVASHNYARIINSRERLLSEIIRLIEHQGHNWTQGKWHVHRGKALQPDSMLNEHSKASMLLNADVIDTSSEEGCKQLTELLHRQSSGQLCRAEKEALARYYFCMHHHIKNAALDEEFLKHHPAEDAEASCLNVLIGILGHTGWAPVQDHHPIIEDGREITSPVRARIALLSEALRALELTGNILETKEVCLTKETLQRLRACKAFTDHKEACRVFGIDSRDGGKGFESATGGRFASRLRAMLDRAGLRCTSKPKQVKGSSRIYTLDFAGDALCLDQQQSMAKLVKLATCHDLAEFWETQSMYNYVQQLQLGEYARYADPNRVSKYSSESRFNGCRLAEQVEERRRDLLVAEVACQEDLASGGTDPKDTISSYYKQFKVWQRPGVQETALQAPSQHICDDDVWHAERQITSVERKCDQIAAEACGAMEACKNWKGVLDNQVALLSTKPPNAVSIVKHCMELISRAEYTAGAVQSMVTECDNACAQASQALQVMKELAAHNVDEVQQHLQSAHKQAAIVSGAYGTITGHTMPEIETHKQHLLELQRNKAKQNRSDIRAFYTRQA